MGSWLLTLKVVAPADLEGWVRRQPTGKYGRRAWYLYETFTGKTLDLEDARMGNYAPLLEARQHLVGPPRRSRRHRVADNLLGTAGFCPTVRRTRRLEERMAERLDRDAQRLLKGVDSTVLTRAVNFLYSKETRSTLRSKEKPRPHRGPSDSLRPLNTAVEFDATDKAALVDLQGTIIEPRYAARELA